MSLIVYGLTYARMQNKEEDFQLNLNLILQWNYLFYCISLYQLSSCLDEKERELPNRINISTHFFALAYQE